jgi:ribonuclease HI
MRQKISVRAIIRNDQKTLLLRRAAGRQSILGKYELPGGSIAPGEQPDDALMRHLRTEMGVALRAKTLLDVVSYIDHGDRDVQYMFIVYLVALDTTYSKVDLSVNYDRYEWRKLPDSHQDQLTDSTKLLLGITQQGDATKLLIDRESDAGSAQATQSIRCIVYSDGGSRGNPGPSAAGYVIFNTNDEVLAQGGVYLGITTNNLAEYQGLLLGLEKALSLDMRVVDFRLDSLLVVNQMNGIYKIKNRELWPVHERINELLRQFDRVTFTHVRRELNQLADGMVNKILNQHADEAVPELL